MSPTLEALLKAATKLLNSLAELVDTIVEQEQK